MRWSPKGTYLATFHQRGIALWGGEKFKQIQRFSHLGVSLIDFSPCERWAAFCFGLFIHRSEVCRLWQIVGLEQNFCWEGCENPWKVFFIIILFLQNSPSLIGTTNSILVNCFLFLRLFSVIIKYNIEMFFRLYYRVWLFVFQRHLKLSCVVCCCSFQVCCDLQPRNGH